MIVDTLATRGRGLCAVVATVAALLLAIPATADAALSISVSPSSPRPGEPVRFSASGTCDGTCWSWSWKVGSTVVDAGGGSPDPYVYESGFPSTGERRVTLNYTRLSLTPPYEFEVSKTFNVVANRAPAASFSFSPAVPIINQIVTFTDTSTDPEGDALTRAWDTDNDGVFDDGDGSTASRSFATAGARQVRLRVRDQYGGETITSRTVTVANGGPQITLSVTPTTVPTGSPVSFSAAAFDPDGGTVTYAWDLDGDGVYNDSTDPVPPARSYPRARTLNISVRVTDDDGTDVSTGQRDQVITVTNRLPSTPTISASPASVLRGESTTLTAAATDPEGTALTYAWDLDSDGAFDDATGASAPQTMPSSGTLTARVRVTDADAGTATSAPFTLTAGNSPPRIDSFTVSPTAVGTGTAVSFAATASDPDGGTVTYAWDLDGDGEFDDSTAASPPSRSYPRSGNRTVGVRVTDDDTPAGTTQRTQVVTVANRAPSVPTITPAPASVARGESVELTAAATDPEGTPLTYAWDLDGDDAYDDATGAKITRTMPSSGTLPAAVQATDADGGTATSAPFTLTAANSAPTATLNVTPTTVATGTAVAFSVTASDPDGGALTYAWDLDGDGAYNDSTAATPPSRSYPRAGARTVGVRVTDDDAASNSTVQRTQVVTVTNRLPSEPTISPLPASVQRGESTTLTASATDPEGTALTYAWDLDDDGVYDDATGVSTAQTMPSSGTLTARVRATDADGGSTNSAKLILAAGNAPPKVDTFSVSPTTVETGAPVSFSATASDPDGGTVTYAWDLDGDGEFDDSTAASPPSRSYPRSGNRTVGVRVTDGDTPASTTQRTQVVTVANRAPSVPTITPAPASVARGESVELTAAATDPEGTALTYAWDLDGDGAFDDATGAKVTRTMPSSGTLAASVRATDADGGTAASAPFSLAAANSAPPVDPGPTPDPGPGIGPASTDPGPPAATDAPVSAAGAPFTSDPAPAATTPPAKTTAPLRLLRPFPRVRIQGRLTRRGAKFTRITVTAPRGTRVQASCDGRGCPRRLSKMTGKSGVVRLTSLLGSYRAGTKIVIRATRAGAIGKYTEIVVRRGKAPRRTDRCLKPGATVPTRCPAN